MLDGKILANQIGLWKEIMPTYDYRCDNCGYCFEAFQTIANRKVPEGRCMECNNGDVRQVVGAPYFAYDNIASKGHTKKTPDWMTDRLKDIKKNQPGADFTIPG